ncbi:unnamed protein product, partial [Pocillopora meandrina]
MIENGFMENPQFRNDGKGDFSTLESKNKVSPQAAINGLQFPKKPEFIDLNELESGVIPTRKEKTQEGDKLYRLWFIVDLTRSVYSAFCGCQGGADQGCR